MLLLKFNLKCNFACDYCYQNPIKPDGTEKIDYDAVEKVVRELHEKSVRRDKDGKPIPDQSGCIGRQIVLHGGEPLFQDKSVIERFLKLSNELYGRSSIQTNGYLIDSDLIATFKKYKTGVGISIDGPYPCNSFRGKGTSTQKKEQTEKVMKNMDKLIENGITPSVIVVVSRSNSLGDRRELLKNWIRELNGKHITGRLNPCFTGNKKFDLTPEELTDFYMDIYDYMERYGISGWSPFADIRRSLLGDDYVECKFRGCDPFATPAATTILNDGSVGVCLRIYQDGKEYLRAPEFSPVRMDVLKQTDCKDCRWWDYCKGGCLGTARDGDWRNKDTYCEVWKALFERTENSMKFLGVDKATVCKPVQTSEQPPEGMKIRAEGEHSDGIEHSDGGWVHLDSNVR